MKYDAKRREYDIVVIGEEPHLAYNRVGLTSFFDHRKVENLYLNPREWVSCTFRESIYYTNLRLLSITVCPKVHLTTI
jgi:nitrite reductase (NAD(P)H)